VVLGKSSVHDVGTDNIAWCSKVRPKPVYPRIRRQPISEDFEKGLDVEGALKLPIIRTAESGNRNARRQHGSSRASSVQDGQPNFTVNVFQEAEKIVKARQKRFLTATTTEQTLSMASTIQVESLSVIPNKEPAQAVSKFTQQNLDILQVYHPWVEAASYSLIR
jgi:hypothetical protein